MDTQNQKMPFIKKFAYGMGNFGGNTAIMIVTSFFVYFCTDSLGLSAGIIGTLLLIAKLLDGITDVIMGFIINKTHSKQGKARFWLLVCAFPLGLTTFLLFWVPSFLRETGSYIYLFLMYVLQSAAFYTMFSVSAQALTSYATHNPADRYSMQSYATLLGILPALILSFLGQTLAASIGWTLTALICGVVTFAAVFFSGMIVKEIPEENVETVKAADKVPFLESVGALLNNKYFWILLIVYFSIYILTGIQGTAAVYYCIYIFASDTALGWLYVAMYAPLILFVGFIPKIVEKIGARKANTFGAILSIVTAFIAFINTNSILVVGISLFLVTLGGLPAYVTLTPLIAEISDNIKMKKGKDITAMCYACSSVGVKAGTGLGTAIAGILLTASGYDGMAMVQSAGAINGIKLMFLVSPIIAYVIMAICYSLLNVVEENKKLKEQSAQ